jgi:squalene-hopene/tetraprenyl-beta-curcumene cyclase
LAGLCYAAPQAAAPAIARGLARIDAMGGLEALRDKSVCSLGAVALRLLSLSGRYAEDRLMRVPVELALLPRRLRGKLSFTVPGVMSWGVMDARLRPGGPLRRALAPVAERRALSYLDELVDFEGDEGGFEESPLMSSCVAIGLARANVRSDIVRHCVNYLRRTQRADGSWSVNRDLEIPISAYVAIGLIDAGSATELRRAGCVDWFRHRQRNGMAGVTGAPGGGWGWAWPSGWPNTGDTTATMLALHRFGLPPDDPALAAGTEWLLRMQNRNGSWSCFSRNVSLTLDAPCSVMTADTVSTLHDVAGLPVDHPAIAKAVRWFAEVQQSDGSIGCRWYLGLTAGTAGALRALSELGLAGQDTARRCAQWLLSAQNADGGWGIDAGTPSCTELTSWAMLALLASPRHEEVAGPLGAAADYLIRAQRSSDGLWTPTVYGIYFLDVLYASDHHANGHALQALARYRDRLGAEPVAVAALSERSAMTPRS